MSLPEYVVEWVSRAEDRFLAAQALRRHRPPLLDHVCYYAREAAEAYLRSYLLLCGVHFPKAGDLIELVGPRLALDRTVAGLLGDLSVLDPFNIDLLYPGRHATPDDARVAMRSVRRVRKALREALGLEISA